MNKKNELKQHEKTKPKNDLQTTKTNFIINPPRGYIDVVKWFLYHYVEPVLELQPPKLKFFRGYGVDRSGLSNLVGLHSFV